MPVSGKEMCKLFTKKGYRVIRGAGKGSHWKLKCHGKATVIIPNHKELAKGLSKYLIKILKGVSK